MIERVLSDAEPDDVVLIAGKGHENYQVVGTTKHHFDDVEECERVLRARVGV
jgi:UDP-N-acetylmuramoyl-L-alanyl-D-glutamate--2,6-diaminopimelate ligase